MGGEYDSDLFRALCSSRSDPRTITFRVSATAKTHKPQGKCSVRLLHAMQPRSVLAPAMRYISHELRQHLKDLPHLVKDSAEFISNIRGVEFTQSVTVVKVDIKDYF
eukprot:8001633-Pyramimonas_sp.AAC.1